MERDPPEPTKPSLTQPSIKRHIYLYAADNGLQIHKKNDADKVSAKQSLDYSNRVRQEVANLPSPDCGKTLKPRSESRSIAGKGIILRGLTKYHSRESGNKGCNVPLRGGITRVNKKVAS